MDTQRKKGLLEICVLAVLQREPSYGYKIIGDITPCIDISESTLYPILKRLETAGCLITFTQGHNGRLRKYYAITDEGRRRITAFLEEWDELRSVYAFIQNGGVAPQPLPGAGLPQTPAPSKSTGKDLESS